MSNEQLAIYATKVLAMSTHKVNGKTRIITLHEGSTYSAAYFVSEATTASAPQNEWRLLWASGAGINKTKIGFWEFANMTASRATGKEVTFTRARYFVGKSFVSDMVERLTNEYSKRCNPFSMREGGFYASKRNRTFDDVKPVSDRVLYYVDLCPDCGKKHRVSHYPSGKILCEKMESLRNNPGLHYMYHQNGVFYFGYNVFAGY